MVLSSEFIKSRGLNWKKTEKPILYTECKQFFQQGETYWIYGGDEYLLPII